MDIIFQSISGVKPFTIEIGYFDTVLEMKEKIHKHLDIPISKQTLIFNGIILQDELNVHHSEILDRSKIHLIVLDDHPENKINHQVIIKKEEDQPIIKTIHFYVKLPIMKSVIAFEMECDDTIKKLKDKISGMEGVASNSICVRSNGVELLDNQTIVDCQFSDSSLLEAIIVNSSNGVKNLKIQVSLNIDGGKQEKVGVEVNCSDNVKEIRKELGRLNQIFGLNLPKDGFFFIHKQKVMDEDRSFKSHHVGFNDTIDIFSGTISGGL